MTSRLRALPANFKGRDFVVGDIHGMFSVLDAALCAVNFDPACDRLISVGDLIDRGPESHRVLDYLSQPWFFAVRGNHEQIFLDCMDGDKINTAMVRHNISNGLAWILDQPEAHLRAIKVAFDQLPIALEIEDISGKPEKRIGCVHADVPAGMTWDDFTSALSHAGDDFIEMALWSTWRIGDLDARGVGGVARVFFGHSVRIGGCQLGNCFFIDTGAVQQYTKPAGAGMYHYLSLVQTTAEDADVLQRPPAGRGYMTAIARPLHGTASRKPLLHPRM